MCGRYTLFGNWTGQLDDADIQLLVEKELSVQALSAPVHTDQYNVSPLRYMPVLRAGDHHGISIISLMNWGLVPGWAKDNSMAGRMINARSETIREKPSFRNAFRKRRCLIPMNGFYEWAIVPGGRRKQPVFISIPEKPIFLAAGIWEEWPDPATGSILHTFAIITVPANPLLSQFHERMPAIIQGNSASQWLYGDPDTAYELLQTYPAQAMGTRFVSSLVNNAAANGPELLEEISETIVLPSRAPVSRKKVVQNDTESLF
jgi:putative SOS response-associated peptidase YedK